VYLLVEPKDNLGKIAKLFKTNTNAIIEANDIGGGLIKPGQVLKIPIYE